MSGHRSDADFQRYIDALHELGLEPGADADAIRKAWAARQRQCHPDYFPGDAAKAAESGRVNAARDTLAEMAKDGRLTQYGLKAERDRRMGGSGAAPLPRILVILVILGVAGSGKTRGWSEATARRHTLRAGILVPGDNLHVVYACPTIALMEQTHAMLLANGLDERVLHILHGKNTKGGVGPALDKLYPTIPPDRDALVMISHAALFERPLTPSPRDWDLVIDEVPDTLQFIEIDGQVTHTDLTRHIDAVPMADSDLYQLVPKDDDPFYRMGWIARIAINQPYDQGFNNSYQELARALLYGRAVMVRRDQWDELVAGWAQRMARGRTQHGGHLDVLTLVPPHWFRHYRSVLMLGARAMTHLTTLVWRKQWHVEFQPDQRFNLPLKHGVRQSRRTTIHYIFEEPVTRAFLARKAANGETMFMAACEAVARFHARLRYKPFLWSAPLPGEDKEHGVSNTFWLERRSGPRIRAFDPLLRLPGNTKGLNHEIYQQTYNVALLSIVGFTPAQYELLHRLGLTDQEIDKAMMMDVAYQDALRCNLRVMASRAPIHITVLDRRIAEDLATMFENVRIMPYPKGSVPETRRKGKGRPASGRPQQTSTERSRAHRARKAARRAQQAEQKRET